MVEVTKRYELEGAHKIYVIEDKNHDPRYHASVEIAVYPKDKDPRIYIRDPDGFWVPITTTQWKEMIKLSE